MELLLVDLLCISLYKYFHFMGLFNQRVIKSHWWVLPKFIPSINRTLKLNRYLQIYLNGCGQSKHVVYEHSKIVWKLYTYTFLVYRTKLKKKIVAICIFKSVFNIYYTFVLITLKLTKYFILKRIFSSQFWGKNNFLWTNQSGIFIGF